jgi:AcrR family transcriptional regulator
VNQLARIAGKGEHTKRLIASKSRKQFEQKGYAATTMEEIHTETGISKGSIYYHFKNKEELFFYILNESSEEWKKTWKEISAPLHTSTEKLYKLAEHYVSDLQTPLIQTAAEFISSEAADPSVKNRVMEWMKTDHTVFYELLEEGMRNGEFVQTSVDDLTFIIYGLYSGLSMNHHYQDANSLHRLYKIAIDVVLKGIAK